MKHPLDLECAVLCKPPAGPSSCAFRVAHDGRLFVIAEGSASRDAPSRLIEAFLEALPDSDSATPGHRTAVRSAFRVASSPAFADPAPSMTAVAFVSSDVLVASIGKCRCYRVRAGSVALLTPPRQPSGQSDGHASSIEEEPAIEVRNVWSGDRFVICSEGLASKLSSRQVQRATAAAQGAHETCQSLQVAIRGEDDYVVIVVHVDFARDGREPFASVLG